MNNIARIDEFHEHLNSCSQCFNNPFDLCQEGIRLLNKTQKFTGNRKTCILCDQNILHSNCDLG